MASGATSRLLASAGGRVAQRVSRIVGSPASTSRFHTLSVCRSRGVHPALTNMRVQTPWLKVIEARKKAEAAGRSHVPANAAGEESAISGKERTLEPKRMKDSYTSLILELGKDQWLADSYVNALGGLRIGSLFMDLDALAGVCAYKHAGSDAQIVTAAVDGISVVHSPSEFCDLELSGQVVYVGKSSMEIELKVTGVEDKMEIMTCSFTMVAVDRHTKKAVSINPLVCETAEEKALFERGKQYNTSKKLLSKASIERQPPNIEESGLIHSMWLEQQKYKDPGSHVKKPESVIYMGDTKIDSSQIMQPPYRNRHDVMIFGGKLMREAMELAFCCCAKTIHSRPVFLSLDPSAFKKSVPVGSILYLSAVVAYAETTPEGYPQLQVRVDTTVRDVAHASVAEDSGTFNFTFVAPEMKAPLKIMPRTYDEFVKYIDAKRRADQAKQEGEGEVNRDGIM